MWHFPWKYKQSFAIAAGIFGIGNLLELVFPFPILHLGYPYSVIIGLFFLSIPFLLSQLFKRSQIVKWLSSVPAAISSISLYVVLSIIMGFIPQSPTYIAGGIDFGYTHLLLSWQYLFIELYFLLTLGMVIIRRAIPFRAGNIGFLLNHLGLWIVIVGITLGVGDKQKIMVPLTEHQATVRGYNEKGQIIPLPMTLTLKSFTIDDYNPSLVIVESGSGRVVDEKEQSRQTLIEQGAKIAMNGWNIMIKHYLPDASFVDGTFIPFKKRGSVPAAYIEASNAKGVKSKGWISCGNSFSSTMLLQLDKSYYLAMAKPLPKRYSSTLTIYTKDNKIVDTTIWVNKPFTVSGWKLYQTGFDEKMGKWSNISIVTLVRDPWLPVIYGGFFMLILGSFTLFWKGQRNHKNIRE